MFERLIDAKGTFEGKCISVIMSIVLVFGMTNLLAFAEVDRAEAADTEVEQTASPEAHQSDNTSALGEDEGTKAGGSASQGSGDGNGGSDNADVATISSGGGNPRTMLMTSNQMRR